MAPIARFAGCKVKPIARPISARKPSAMWLTWSCRKTARPSGASIGVRAVSESFDDGAEARQSVLLLAGLRKTFLDQGLSISAVWEEPVRLGDGNDESTVFPGRAVFGLDKTLGKTATLNVRHEITDGANASGHNTVAGVTWEPRGGTQLRAATDVLSNESGRRIGATVGVDQVWQVSDAWTLSGGLARRSNVDGDDEPRDVRAGCRSWTTRGWRSQFTDTDRGVYVGLSWRELSG